MSKKLCKSKKARGSGKRSSDGFACGFSHACRKCGRVTNSKKKLCKPTKSVAID